MRRAALALVLVASVAFSAVASEEAGAAETVHAEFPMLDGSGDGGDGADFAASASGTRQIVFGEKVALDELGPIIVNEDCTMRRIENWREMTERERRGTQKRIAERNALRLGNCRDRYAKGGIWRDAYSDLGTWKGPSEGFASESEHDEL